jgi:hypothetical protein
MKAQTSKDTIQFVNLSAYIPWSSPVEKLELNSRVGFQNPKWYDHSFHPHITITQDT